MLNIQFSDFPELRSERLLLREITLADAEEIFFLRSDPRMMQYLDRPPLASIAEGRIFIQQKIIDSYKNNEGIDWGITLQGQPKLIGLISFWRFVKEHHRAEIGYGLHPDFWKRGIVSEAINCVLDHGFEEMKLHSVEANVNPDNLASIKVLEKNGFIREAYFKENYHYNGQFLDSAI